VLPELYESLIVAYQQAQAYHAYDDVGPTLQQLREAGVKMGVVTNTDSRIRAPTTPRDFHKANMSQAMFFVLWISKSSLIR